MIRLFAVIATVSVAVLADTFPCTDVSPSQMVPESVHKLRPADVKVVAAMGDSITAAFGAEATSLLNLANEWRGVSWSIGGDQSYDTLTTLPNILKEFNPQLKGWSYAKGSQSTKQARLNVAISGAIAQGMPGQARTLIEKLKADETIDYDADWKVVTLWIGGNDLCAVCKGHERNTPSEYARYIEEALDILATIPRTFVNLVSIIDVTRLYEVKEGNCVASHAIVCPCGTSPDDATRVETSLAFDDYVRLTHEIASRERFQSRDDFTVVVQPFFEDTQVPLRPDGTPDRSYFAPDCFHFTTKAHVAGGLSLWNNMLEPVGSKSIKWSLGDPLKCPSEERPYLATGKNSALSSVAGVSDVIATTTPANESGEKSGHKTVLIAVSSAMGLVALLAVTVMMVVQRRRRAGYDTIKTVG